MEQTPLSFSPDIFQSGYVSAFISPEVPPGDAEGVGVPAECEARQQPPPEEQEEHVVPVPFQTIHLAPVPLQGFPNHIGMTCDLPHHRTDTPENTSSGSSAGTNQITADRSSESPHGTCPEHLAQTPDTQLRTARMRTAFPTNAPYIEEVVPDKGPVTGGMRIFIIGDHFPEGDHLYVRFGSAFARAVSSRLSSRFIRQADYLSLVEAAQRAYFVVSPPPCGQCWEGQGDPHSGTFRGYT